MKRFNFSDAARKAGRRYKLMPVFLLVLSTLTFTTVTPAAELLVNGGFEEPALTTFARGSRAFDYGWTTFFGQNFTGTCTIECNLDASSNTTLIPGWSAVWTDTWNDPVPSPGRIEIQSAEILILNPGISAAKGGTQKAELDSHDRVGEGLGNHNVTLFQEAATCHSAAYTLTYNWKSRRAILGDNDTDVMINGAVVRTHSMTADWVTEIINFVSDNTGFTEIAFQSKGDGNTYGMSLDNVSLSGPAPDDCPPPVCEFTESDDPLSCGDDKESACDLCLDGKPTTLTLMYDADDYTFHSQDPDRVSVVNHVDGPLPDNVFIEVGDEKNGKVLYTSTGTVKIGDLFDVKTQGGFMIVKIFDGITLLQTITFHTSCSQPLNKLDTFGGITIWDGTW